PQPGPVIVGGITGELDTEMPSAGKPDQQHRQVHPGMLDGDYRPAAEHGLKAPGQLLAPMRAGEDMHIAAKSDHDPACPSSDCPLAAAPRARPDCVWLHMLCSPAYQPTDTPPTPPVRPSGGPSTDLSDTH